MENMAKSESLMRATAAASPKSSAELFGNGTLGTGSVSSRMALAAWVQETNKCRSDRLLVCPGRDSREYNSQQDRGGGDWQHQPSSTGARRQPLPCPAV